MTCANPSQAAERTIAKTLKLVSSNDLSEMFLMIEFVCRVVAPSFHYLLIRLAFLKETYCFYQAGEKTLADIDLCGVWTFQAMTAAKTSARTAGSVGSCAVFELSQFGTAHQRRANIRLKKTSLRRPHC